MKAKRLFSLLLTACMLAGMLQLGVSAEATSGTCGENLTWVLEGDTLTISGTGPMYDYSETNPAPWTGASVKLVEVQAGATTIGNYAFKGLSPRDFVLGDTIEVVGRRAFYKTDALDVWFTGKAPQIAEDAFEESHNSICTIQQWDAAVKKKYGGDTTWVLGDFCPQIVRDESRQMYGLNEPFKMSDLMFKVSSIKYRPSLGVVSSYDNSTEGLKTVTIQIGEHTLNHEFMVAEDKEYLKDVQVQLPAYISYNTAERKVLPTVTWNGITLKKDVHYRLSYSIPYGTIDTELKVWVTGIGMFEGYTSMHYYAVLRQDISECDAFWRKGVSYTGEPTETKISINCESYISKPKYAVVGSNNTNCGQAYAYLVSQDSSYYGMKELPYTISTGKEQIYVEGAYNGLVTEELNGEVNVQEAYIPAGQLQVRVKAAGERIAYYELYRMEEDGFVLVTSYESPVGYDLDTEFYYDLSDVYNTESEMHGEVYMLSYTCVDAHGKVYVGALVLGVLGKAPDATEVALEHVENDQDFRREYFGLVGVDGNVGIPEWTSSDETVAVVEKGQVTFKKPGTVTITGAYGGVSASQEVTAQVQDLTTGEIFGMDVDNNTAYVAYDGFLLEEGVDYNMDIRRDGEEYVVTVAGKGFFQGQLERRFDAMGFPVEEKHTHSFDNCEDLTCATCTYQRTQAHAYDEKWNKSETEHWHACRVCEQEKDRGEHILSADNDKLCQTCGQLYMVGDVDDDGEVTDWDGVLLARYLAGWPVDVPIVAALDVDGDGEVTDWDGVIMDRYLAGWNVTIG